MKQNDYTTQLLDQSAALFWVVDRDYLLVYANKSYQNLMLQGTGAKKELNKPVFAEGFGEGYTEKWKAFYDRAFQGEHFEIEEHFYHPETKKIQYGQNTFEPLYDADSKVYAIACQWKDITRIVKQRSEANQLIDASLDVFCTINSEGYFVYISAAVVDLWGYLPEELVNTPFLDLILEEDIAKTNAITSAIFNGEEIRSFENRYKKKNGDIAYNLWSARWDSETKLIYCVARDGKEKNEHDKIIQLSEQRFKALVQEGSDMVTILDEDGNYKFVSPTNQIVLGFTPEEYIGKNAFQFIHPDDEQRTLESLKKISRTKTVVVEPYRFLNYKKEWRWIETVLTNMLDNPAINGIVSNSRDITDKVVQDALIQRSELRFKALVQDGSDMISIVNAEGKYIYTSPTTTSILGITPEDFLHKSVFDFVHPDDAAHCMTSMKEVITEKRVVVPPFRLRDGKHEWRWIETVLTNMLDNPAVQGLVANSRDITEAINTRKQIEASEQFNRTVLESSPDCFKILDIEGQIQYMNYNGLCQMEIDDFSTVKNKKWSTLWGPQNELLVQKALDKALSGEVAHFTALCATAKGTPKWWDVLVSPVGKQGEPIDQIISVSRDITKQKKEEQRLKLLTSVITNTHDAVLITEAEPLDHPGPIIIYVNDAFTKMTGYTAEEVIGKSPRILQGPNSNSEDLQKLGEAIRKWESYEVTTINYKKNGEEFWINFTVTPVADNNGWYTHWIAIERDVTLQKNKELEKELLAQISTDFNTKKNYIKAAKSLCKTLSNFGKFDLIELWVPSVEKNAMKLLCHYLGNQNDLIFYDTTEGVNSLQLNEGLCGTVWAEKTQILWDRIEISKQFVRKKAAEKIGLKSLLGVPLIIKNEVIGVLQIGTKKDVAYLKKHCEILAHLEQFIASELNRKKLETDLNIMFASIPDIVCTIDFNGRFVKINQAVTTILGYTEEELLFQSYKQFIHPEDIDIAATEFEKIIKGQSTFKFEVRYLTKKGEIVWLSWNSQPSIDEGVVFSIVKSITEEKKLRELNEKVGSLAKIGSWEVDFSNQSLYWSEEVHKMHETDPNTYTPELESAITFYREDFREMVKTGISNSISSGEAFDFEAVVVTTNKKEIWVRSIGNPEFINGACTKFYGSFQDISSIKDVEQRLQSLSNNLPGIIFQYLIHPDGTDSIRSIQGDVEELWGFTKHQVTEGFNIVWNQIKKADHFDEVQNSILSSITNKAKWTSRVKYMHPNGELRTHIGHGTPSFLVDGTILFNSIVLDITQEAKNEMLLEEASKIARLGSWEMDVLNEREDGMYWSPIIWDILELDKNYDPSLTGLIELQIGESKTLTERAINRLIQDGVEFEEELLLITGKGNKCWVKASGKSERINNVCVKIYGSFQDITERKNTELKIVQSEQEYRALAFQLQLQQTHLENAQKIAKIGSWETNLKDFTLSWSDETYRIFGIDNDGEDMNHQKFMSHVHPLDQEKVEKALGDSLMDSTKRNHFIEHRILSKDGTEKTVEERWKVDFDENETPLIAVGSCQDITERKKSELERNSLLTTIENSLNEIYIFDYKTFKFNYLNKGALVNLGYTEDEIRNLTPFDIKPDFNLESFKDLISPLINKEKSKIIFFTSHERKDGTLYPTEVHLQLVSIGNKKSFIAIVLDITERKKAEEEFILVYKEKNSILERITEAFVSLDSNWCYTHMNKKAGEIFNTDPETIVGKHIWTEFPEGRNQSLHRAYEKAMKTQEYCYVEEYYEPYNMWFENHIYPSTNGLSVFFRDVTARKRIEEQLRKSNERFEKVTEATNDAIWDWDIINNTFFRSKAIERFFGGTTLQTLVGTDLWKDKFHEDDLAKIQESVNEALANPTVNRWEFEYRIYNDKREIIYIIDRGLIIRDDLGEAIRMVGAMTDITHQKQLTLQLSELNHSLKLHAQELERSNEELEQFAFVASHDLQEPLRMISSFMDLLKRKYGDLLDEKALRYIYFATDGATRMKKIILDLLDYSRAGKSTEEKESIELNEIINSYKLLRRSSIKNKSVEINSDSLPVLLSYKAAVTQVFHCLLDNAIKYSTEGIAPIIEINALEKELEWQFSIKDNGIGIDSQFFSKIFVIFQRLHNNEEYEGTGIGLSIVKRQVEFLGGSIWVESKLGKGSIFYFTIPKN
ncbi:PAS domain S-box protein [Flavobacterium sp. F-380]|uniref:histidine kinase n=1 Tax=Flavobacterium kayseriense TaxID=2764714 RepID=A0ABR7J992_9FLAO|nr:PAS domain S-box protein [Flavobacterium kayseriense]MBC5842115.1 PAS domain S-box protein [Flavobacterium kayseriense]MBC5848645.1 PAS domain S-box protein [Flavobacterium kayseriense]